MAAARDGSAAAPGGVALAGAARPLVSARTWLAARADRDHRRVLAVLRYLGAD